MAKSEARLAEIEARFRMSEDQNKKSRLESKLLKDEAEKVKRKGGEMADNYERMKTQLEEKNQELVDHLEKTIQEVK